MHELILGLCTLKTVGKPEDCHSSGPSQRNCALCHESVPANRDRKLLSANGAGKVHPEQLVQFCSIELLSHDVEEAVTRLQPGKNYIYKPCQDQLNQWVKLKDKMTARKGR